jgi:hypothetical protein
MARWSYANVLSAGTGIRRLWQFSPSGDHFNLSREHSSQNGEGIPENLVGKDWSSLWQPKLNIAWLPAEKIFLRVLQLPVADAAETASMVELQLEKLSPLPVAQVVWTFEVLGKKEDGQQSVIVVVVPRSLVEEFLGQLEGQGFLADRLELPLLDQLLATEVTQDGVWVFPGETTTSPCLVAWWYGGLLRNITLLSWVDGADALRLKDQLAQMAWSGELEGWLSKPPHWYLVADATVSAIWQPLLAQVAGEPIEVVAPLPAAKLAALSARRAVRSEGKAELLPVEYARRYRQQFIDRLWMRGLFAMVALYMAGLVVYFAAVYVMRLQLYKVQKQVNELSLNYTNVLQLHERLGVLEDQSALKFAALDCWKTASDLLPQELTLTQINFQNGKTMGVFGTVSQENAKKVYEYYDAMSKATTTSLDGKITRQTFQSLDAPSIPPAMPGPNGTPIIRWSFICKLPEEKILTKAKR